ncbi:hypothetical protein [Lactobacillus helveticus]|uniref:DUF4145 domain-containing protein n=1 Tax=Lactobacillus helveticus TaxID=1587 RepID=A0AAC9EZI5_LACHE|nr:hypothetical protein [Lactobacillus helveticus]ALI53218.1 hypothetical protein ALV80_09480 [Lactobacillus helveticus]
MDKNKIIIDYLNVLVNILRYAGWQILILVIFLYYRKEIPNFIKSVPQKLKKVTFNQVSIEFAQKVDSLKQYQDSNVKNNKISKDYIDDSNFVEVNRVRPDLGIFMSWQEVEFMLHEKGITKINSKSMQSLAQKGIIDSSQAKLISNLKKLRNQITHDPSLRVRQETARS